MARQVTGLTETEADETRPCECTEPGCVCTYPVGGPCYEADDGWCWDCDHGQHRVQGLAP